MYRLGEWTTLAKVIEKDRAKILWDFQIQTNKIFGANQLDIVVVDKQDKMAVVIDITFPSDSNMRKREYKKLER